MMSHTSKTNSVSRIKKPPYEMIPELGVIKKPTSYDRVETVEALHYEYLKKEHGVTRRYGYIDYKSAQMMEDGLPSSSLKCIKLCITDNLYFLNMLAASKKSYTYILMSGEVKEIEQTKKEILKWLPDNSQITAPVPVSVDKRVNDTNNEEWKITQSFQPHHPLTNDNLPLTMTKTISVLKSNHFITESPSMPTPKILSVPVPWVWQHPFVGIGMPMASGGVTTRGFGIKQEKLHEAKETYPETQHRYSRKGSELVVKAEHTPYTEACNYNTSEHQLIITPPSFLKGVCPNPLRVKTNHHIGSWNLKSCRVKKL